MINLLRARRCRRSMVEDQLRHQARERCPDFRRHKAAEIAPNFAIPLVLA
jgi:hypothetical protein